MTVPQLAHELGLTEQAIRKRIKAGSLKAEMVSTRLYLIEPSEVERQKQLGRLKPGPKLGSKRTPKARPDAPQAGQA
jgi:hypothetical protein